MPSLPLRGALSDILTRETAEGVSRRPRTRPVTVRDRGHAPDLSEAEALHAIQSFLLMDVVRDRPGLHGDASRADPPVSR